MKLRRLLSALRATIVELDKRSYTTEKPGFVDWYVVTPWGRIVELRDACTLVESGRRTYLLPSPQTEPEWREKWDCRPGTVLLRLEKPGKEPEVHASTFVVTKTGLRKVRRSK